MRVVQRCSAPGFGSSKVRTRESLWGRQQPHARSPPCPPAAKRRALVDGFDPSIHRRLAGVSPAIRRVQARELRLEAEIVANSSTVEQACRKRGRSRRSEPSGGGAPTDAKSVDKRSGLRRRPRCRCDALAKAHRASELRLARRRRGARRDCVGPAESGAASGSPPRCADRRRRTRTAAEARARRGLRAPSRKRSAASLLTGIGRGRRARIVLTSETPSRRSIDQAGAREDEARDRRRACGVREVLRAEVVHCLRLLGRCTAEECRAVDDRVDVAHRRHERVRIEQIARASSMPASRRSVCACHVAHERAHSIAALGQSFC